ncbi:unnamed protein product [Trifolium pratense]|uniref:Uncharacterized protein n=1 Tax=Trifolium pratense TaxID=57577 RepID=A0ACB0K1Y0_TRIPR|nr:unnamed protein product [Trifolium pratense]
MEAIRISCAGYPTRKTFDEFVDRFGLLAPEALDRSSDEVTACKKVDAALVDCFCISTGCNLLLLFSCLCLIILQFASVFMYMLN